MLIVIGTVVSFVGLVSVFLAEDFSKKEGKDERGDKILGIAGKSAYFAFLVGYSIILVIDSMNLLKNSTQFEFVLTCLLALVVISYTATIMVMKRRY